MKAPQSPGERTHEEKSHGQGQEAKEGPAEQVGFQDGLEHGQHGLEASPAHETAPGDGLPMHAVQIQGEAFPKQDAARVHACRGDGHQGPGVVEKGRDQHERPVHAPKQGAAGQHHDRVQSQQRIQGNRKPDGETPSDLVFIQFWMEDVGLGASPKARGRGGGWVVVGMGHQDPGAK